MSHMSIVKYYHKVKYSNRVFFESGADLDRLRQLIPTNIEQYKVKKIF